MREFHSCIQQEFIIFLMLWTNCLGDQGDCPKNINVNSDDHEHVKKAFFGNYKFIRYGQEGTAIYQHENWAKVYMYKHISLGWMVGNKIGGNRGYIQNLECPYKCPVNCPTSWSYVDATSLTWIKDSSIKVKIETSEKQGCIKWRQTENCAWNGPRDERNDQACDIEIPAWSGYCECANGEKKMKKGCYGPEYYGYSYNTCEAACNAEETLTIIGTYPDGTPFTGCYCSPLGSENRTCNKNTGQCFCKVGYSGKHCNSCENKYLKNTDTSCAKCNCTNAGATSESCDFFSGRCFCKAHVRGFYCDECDDGFHEYPQCKERGSASSVSQEAIVGMISAGFIMLILASISVLMLIRKRRIQAKERSPTQVDTNDGYDEVHKNETDMQYDAIYGDPNEPIEFQVLQNPYYGGEININDQIVDNGASNMGNSQIITATRNIYYDM